MKRPLWLVALACMAGAGTSTFAQTQVPMEPEIEARLLRAINQARADPAGYAATLRVYRGYFRDRTVRFPGNPVGLITREGVVPVDEAIRFLATQSSLPPLVHAPILARAATDHVEAQGPTGLEGHRSPDGAGPGERVSRRGGGLYVGEIISYGTADAASVLRQFVVDDNVPGRGHRLAIFNTRYRHAGISCGTHRRWGAMCVVVLSASADGR